jgi:site-specific DNA recombinase
VIPVDSGVASSALPVWPAIQCGVELSASSAGADTANYARISDDPGSRRRGVDRQLRDGREVAARVGRLIFDDYVDNDRSAFRGLQRRQDYHRLCADIRAGKIRYVIFWRVDRLHRDTREGEDFIDLCVKHHVILIPHSGIPVDLSSPEGEKWFRDQVANARYESRVLSLRSSRAARDYASQGVVSRGGDRAFGWEADRITLRPLEAKFIQDAYRLVEAGASMRSLIRELQRRGIPTVRGGPWSSTVLRNLLMNPRLCGLRAYKGEVLAKGKWQPIVSEEQWERVRGVILERSRQDVRSPRRYLLSGGRLRCGQCGAAMVARPKEDGRRNYVCALPPNFHGCGKCAILAEPLEGFLVNAVLLRLDAPALWERLRRPEGGDPEAELVARIARKREKLEEAGTLWREDAISRRQYVENTQALRLEIDQLSRQLSRLHRVALLNDFDGAAALRARWEELGIERRQAILDVLISHATVGRAVKGRNRFDPKRISVTWKV